MSVFDAIQALKTRGPPPWNYCTKYSGGTPETPEARARYHEMLIRDSIKTDDELGVYMERALEDALRLP